MRSSLERGDRALVRVSAALASRDDPALRDALNEAALRARETEIEEVLVQSYLFLGFPAALNALALWRECSGRPPPRASEDDPEGWTEKGEAVCRRIYGDQYSALRRNIATFHPDMDRWMVAEGYGKVLGREGLDLGVRELCIAALLSVLDVPVQLYSHVRGCLRLGWPPEVVQAALDIADEFMSEGARNRSREVSRRVFGRITDAGGSNPVPDRNE